MNEKYFELLFVLIGISIGIGIAAVMQELRWKLKRKIEKQWGDPQWDATDLARPAFWRGEKYSCNMFCKILNKVLDGEEPIGKMYEPMEKLRQRVWGLVCENKNSFKEIDILGYEMQRYKNIVEKLF